MIVVTASGVQRRSTVLRGGAFQLTVLGGMLEFVDVIVNLAAPPWPAEPWQLAAEVIDGVPGQGQEHQGHDQSPDALLGREGDEHGWRGGHAQWGPSRPWPVVSVPMGGPRTTCLVSTTTCPPSTDTANRSSPRGAGPPFFSPTRLYLDPWQGHSNHCEAVHQGTRQPRCTHFW